MDKVTGSLFGFCPRIAACPANCPLFKSVVAQVCGRTPRMQIWGQTRCLRHHADLVPDTLFVHETKAAASCRTPNASRLPTPSASAAAREKPLGLAARSNEAIWGQTRSWLGAARVAPWRRRKALTYHKQDKYTFTFPRKRGVLTAIGGSAPQAIPRPRPLESRL